MPGAKPLRINVIKFAESRRTKNFAIKGAPKEPSVQARTAYQLVYPDGTVMIDSGMDLPVHKFFGRGVEEPYFPNQEKLVEQALKNAREGTVEAVIHSAFALDDAQLRELERRIDEAYRAFTRSYGPGLERAFSPLLALLIIIENMLLAAPWWLVFAALGERAGAIGAAMLPSVRGI